MLLPTLLAAVTGGATSAALAVVLQIPLRRRLNELEMGLSESLPALITRDEVSEAFTRMAIAEQEREQAMNYRLQQEQAMRLLELQRMRATGAPQPAPIFQAEASPQQARAEGGATGDFQPQPGQAQVAVDQMNEQLNRQLAQLNQRLQQVAAQRLPR
jgi:hypothetical protein